MICVRLFFKNMFYIGRYIIFVQYQSIQEKHINNTEVNTVFVVMGCY